MKLGLTFRIVQNTYSIKALIQRLIYPVFSFLFFFKLKKKIVKVLTI